MDIKAYKKGLHDGAEVMIKVIEESIEENPSTPIIEIIKAAKKYYKIK